MKTRNKLLPILPADTFFFSLPLAKDEQRKGKLIITREILNQHYSPLPKGRYPHRGVQTSYVGFNNEMVTIKVNLSAHTQEYTLYLHVTAEELQVACSCSMPGQLLCLHAYLGLYALIWQSVGLKLNRFYWPEFTVNKSGVNRFFKVTTSNYDITIAPRKEFGNIYKPVLGFSDANQLIFDDTGTEDSLAGLPEKEPDNKEVIGYAILHDTGGVVMAHLPVIMPFIAINAKQGNSIGKYLNYVTKDNLWPHSIMLTDNQIMLNELSHDMLTLAKQTGLAYQDHHRETWERVSPLILNLWKMVIPKLQSETYLQSVYSHGLRNIKQKPRKSAMEDAAISKDELNISFAIRNHGNHYTIEPVLKANGSEIISFRKEPLFVINTVSNHFYLLNNLRDDQLLNWLDKSGNRLTVLKAHFKEFEQEYLSRLVKHYPFVYHPYKSKKGEAYDLRNNLVRDRN